MRRIICFMTMLCLMAACSTTDSPPDVASLPQGNAEQGATLFTESIGGAPSCSSCHAITDATLVGPGLAGFSQRAGTQVEGLSAEAYTFDSILHPASHIVDGFVNLMYPQYESKLTAQNLADLIAYLLTL